MQSSCCKPPTHCDLEFHNATYWTMPQTGPAVADNDCKTWSNVQSKLCYNCQSCKMAFLDHIKNDWNILSFVNLGLLLFVLFVYGVGCCAFRNNKAKGHHKKKQCPAWAILARYISMFLMIVCSIGSLVWILWDLHVVNYCSLPNSLFDLMF